MVYIAMVYIWYINTFKNMVVKFIGGCSTDKFDNNVFKCINKNDHVAKEPYFQIYAFMTVSNENKLLCYESYLHKMGFDIMNC